MISTQRRRDAEEPARQKAKAERRLIVSFYSSAFKTLRFCVSAFLICFLFAFAENSFAQSRKPKPKSAARKTQTAPKNQAVSNLPKVTQIDAEALKKLLVSNGKPLLINFWATWCEPCREEFPDLVKIGADYKDKIDLITVSLDDLAEIKGDVPKFLAMMKSDAPAYLLKTADEEAAIAAVSKDWQGGLPFTILFNAGGEAVYFKQGKFETEILRQQIENLTKEKP